jgi:hypothetical protein
MTAKTFDEWWSDRLPCINDDAYLYKYAWEAAIKSLEGVQTQPTNSRYATALAVYHDWASDATPHHEMPDFDVWCKQRLHADERHDA